MRANRHVLVVGAGNAERTPDGGWATKTPIANYLHGLADEFGHCVWITQASGTWMVDLPEGNQRIAGQLDPSRIRVIPMDHSFFKVPYFCLVLIREALHRPYAILFLPAIITLIPALPFVKFLCKRVAVYLAGDFETPARELASQKWFGWSTLYRKAFEISLWIADIVIARGRFLSDTARKHNCNVIETVPLAHLNFDALAHLQDLQPDSNRRILFLGLLLWSKGLGELLQAMRQVVDSHPNCSLSLDLLGDGPDRTSIENLCRELGLEQQVHFHGWVERPSEIEGFFRTADLVVMPTSTHPEGVPRVIEEALVRGIPVVATRISGVPSEFRNNEVCLVNCADPNDLAKGIDGVLFDSEIRQRYVEGAIRRRNHWLGEGTAAKQHTKILREEIESE